MSKKQLSNRQYDSYTLKTTNIFEAKNCDGSVVWFDASPFPFGGIFSGSSGSFSEKYDSEVSDSRHDLF